MTARVALLRAGALTMLLASGVVAQSAEPVHDDADGQYSRDARRAVERFERRRRFLLPLTRGDPGRCDVHIGSYCYWYDENEAPGPPEPARIAEARHRLLALLDSLAARHPDDGWLAGQRVRYRLEEGDPAGALRAVAACGADRWWCTALAGLALHRSDSVAAADSAFAVALSDMPGDVACRWRDIGILLDDDARRRYRSLPCPAREPVERRFWWLAAPLWSEPGNEARTEYLSRVVLGAIAERGATPYGGRWTDDMNELLLRYGWPGRWSRRERGSGATPEVAVVGHDASPSYQWPANSRLLEAPFDAVAGDWTPRDPRARSRSLARRARRLHDLDAVVTLLRRGDSLRALAAVVIPAVMPAYARDGAAAALVLALDTAALAAVHAPVAGEASLLLEASAPEGPLLASIEMTGDSGQAARVRMAVRPPPLDRGFGISDLLLYLPEADADTTIDDARMAPVASVIRAGERPLGVYWELYGLGDGVAAVRTELRVQGERPGWMERAWRRLRGGARAAPVRLHWTDVTTGGAERARAVFIRLDMLPEGAYTMELTATAPGGRTVTARRILHLAR
ncbi:MAG: hypothetical protein ACYC2G_17810 [Gemmatimonadaceae bacterium]